MPVPAHPHIRENPLHLSSRSEDIRIVFGVTGRVISRRLGMAGQTSRGMQVMKGCSRVILVLLHIAAAAAIGSADASEETSRPALPHAPSADQNARAPSATRVGGFFRVPELPFPEGPWPARQVPSVTKRPAELEARATADDVISSD